MLNTFLHIIKDAKRSGARIFNEWVSNPDKFLEKSELPIDQLLLSLSEDERKKFMPLLEYFTELSFYTLFKRLEEGESNYSFSLYMKNEVTNQVCTLISDQIDNEIRDALQEL